MLYAIAFFAGAAAGGYAVYYFIQRKLAQKAALAKAAVAQAVSDLKKGV
jgi:hypothetical protein